MDESQEDREHREDRIYQDGKERAYLDMLGTCLRALMPTPEAIAARWASERAEAIIQLRKLCEDHGDNEWTNDLHLADIIDKHLGRYLT